MYSRGKNRQTDRDRPGDHTVQYIEKGDCVFQGAKTDRQTETDLETILYRGQKPSCGSGALAGSHRVKAERVRGHQWQSQVALM